MKENQDKPDKKLSDESKSIEEEQIELREISEEELKKIIERHEMWLESNGNEGERADLQKADLRGEEDKRTNLKGFKLRRANFKGANIYHGILENADLTSANLRKTNLNGANLQNSYLTYANLMEAKLTGANFKKADLEGAQLDGTKLDHVNLEEANLVEASLQNARLTNAKLKNARLSKADFSGADLSHIDGFQGMVLYSTKLEAVYGLLGNEFAQSDLTGAKIPENIGEFKTLDVVEETSKNARKILFVMLLGCVYSWLTIATTTDVRLLTNSASSPLPIIGTEIPIAWFYWAAPFALMAVYVYFHYYLSSLWECLSSLPAVFPDGKRLDERVYPWLLNRLVRRQFKLLKENRPLIAHQQEWVTIFFAWWTVPVTFIGFWLRYLPRHEWFGTWLHIVLLTVSITLAIFFSRMSAQILRGQGRRKIQWQTIWHERRFYYNLIAPIVAGLLLFLISYGAINGVRPPSPETKTTQAKKELNYFRITEVMPWAFQKIGYSPFANFREKDVSIKPNDYYRIEDDEKRVESVKGANLKDRNLAFADMVEAFLIKADLRNANLQHADLEGAKLQKANLENSSLQGAELKRANLQGADLRDANLKNAFLEEANMQKAHLRHAILTEVAYLRGANLKGAGLWGAELQKANLREANLQGADLRTARLQGADLTGTDFTEANLEGADLREAEGLIVEQLCKAFTLNKAELDPELKNQVKGKCHEKLMKPKKVKGSPKAQKPDDGELATLKKLLVPNSLQADAAVQLLIEKGFFTREEFFVKLKQLQADNLSKTND